MKKIWILAAANLHKSKGNTVTLVIMFLLAALLLNAGLLVSLNFGNFFANLTDELNTSDIYYMIPDKYYVESIDEFLADSEHILEYEKHHTVASAGTTLYENQERELYFLFHNADESRALSKWKYVGEQLPVASDTVYLPYIFNSTAGYSLGDTIEIELQGQTLVFTIGGFIEDAYFSSIDTGVLGVYLPGDHFEELYGKLDPEEYRTTLVFADTDAEGYRTEETIRELAGLEDVYVLSDATATYFSFNKSLLTMSRVTMPVMVAVIMIAFAAIIVVICIIVVRFRIQNSIEDDMLKIGSLKAVGYTSRQIISSMILQFSLCTLCGSILGLFLSYPLLPVISDLFAQQSGLKWEQGFDAFAFFITLGGLLLVVLLVAFISARRIKTLSPIVALRGGVVTHNFRRNHIPLDRSRGNLSLLLAMKQILQNAKQSLMIVVIVTAVSFAGAFGVLMLYNTTIDTTAFMEVPGIELSNVIIIVPQEEEHDAVVSETMAISEVEKAQFIDETVIKIEGYNTSVYIMEDYSQKKTNSVYEGRYPLHDNEIVLSAVLAKQLDKTIGDMVTLQNGENQVECLVTGLSQGMNMGGENASIRHGTMLELNPDFVQSNLQVYLEEGTDAAEFASRMEDQFGDRIYGTVDGDKSMEDGVGVYTSIVSKVGTVVFIVSIAVVLLVLYLVIQSSIMRQRRNFGVQKAVGFTTLQLMHQLSVGFILPLVLGVTAGTLLSVWLTNPIMSVAQRVMGVMKTNYTIEPSWLIVFALATICIAYVASLAITSRIRKISAYALVTE